MPKVVHAVLLRFQPQVPQEKTEELFAQLRGLKELIPGILAFSGGPYSSWEGRNRGYTHGFVMTFADEASRDAYLPHPEHKRVVEQLLPLLDAESGALAFDWLDSED